MAEFRKNTGQTRSEGGSCDETTVQKRSSLCRQRLKKVVSFLRKNRGDIISLPVAAPGDTNPSDATEQDWKWDSRGL